MQLELFKGTAPDLALVAGLTALGAGVGLFRSFRVPLVSSCAGFLAGTLSGLLESTGVPFVFAVPAAVLVPMLSIWLARHDATFAPPRVREEALLLMLVLGLGAAVVPGVVEGWRSAGALNAAISEGVNRAMPAWVLLLSGASVVLGGAWSLWRHR